MQFFTGVREKVAILVSENATTLLTAAGVVGTVATGVLAGRAGYKSAEILRAAQIEKQGKIVQELEAPFEGQIPKAEDILTTAEKAKIFGLQFAPPVVLGAGTVAAIIMSHRMSAQKAAALAAAYGLAERNLSDYKEKVAEKLTGPKKEALETEISQDRVNNTPGYDKVVIIEGDGDVLCFDEPTGRYFKSNPEKIRRAVNATNTEILRHGGASASYFYDELEQPPTTWSEVMGWGIGEQMDVKFDYVKNPADDKPVLSIEFTQMPSLSWNDSYK